MDEENSSAIVRPITSSPLSAESRQAMFSRATVSSASFRGNAELVSARRDNQETLTAIQSNQQTLSGIQQEIVSLRQEIGGLNPGLLKIADLIERDAQSDEQSLREQQERERRLAEQKIRIGKEDELENKIQNAIVAPVQKLTPKVNNLFEGVGGALTALFAGWLINQTIEYIKAEGKKNTDRMLEIKNNIIRNIGTAAGILVAIRSGFSSFINVLRGVIGKVASLLGKIIAAPFKGAAAAAGAVTNIFTGKGKGGKTPPPKPGTPPKPGGGPGRIIRGLAGPVLSGGLVTAADIAGGEDPARATAGATGSVIGGTLGGFLGAPLGPVGSLLFGTAGGYYGQQVAKDFYDTLTGNPKNQSNKSEESPTSPTSTAPSSTTPSSAKVTPQSPKIDSKPADSNPVTTITPSDSTSRPQSDVMMQGQNASSVNPKQEEKTLPTAVVSSTQTPQEVQNKAESVGPLTEPKPTVVMAPPTPQKQPTQPPMNSGPLADVPLISSANPDNFYVLYSQMHYNVVV